MKYKSNKKYKEKYNKYVKNRQGLGKPYNIQNQRNWYESINF